MELNQIPQNPNNWGNVADLLNENSGKIEAETAKLNNATTKFKGYFSTSTALSAKWPSPLVGDTAWVGETYPGVVYRCNVAGAWLATTDVPPSNTVNLSEYATQDAVSKELASVRSDLSIYSVSIKNNDIKELNLYRGNVNGDYTFSQSYNGVFAISKSFTLNDFVNILINDFSLSMNMHLCIFKNNVMLRDIVIKKNNLPFNISFAEGFDYRLIVGASNDSSAYYPTQDELDTINIAVKKNTGYIKAKNLVSSCYYDGDPTGQGFWDDGKSLMSIGCTDLPNHCISALATSATIKIPAKISGSINFFVYGLTRKQIIGKQTNNVVAGTNNIVIDLSQYYEDVIIFLNSNTNNCICYQNNDLLGYGDADIIYWLVENYTSTAFEIGDNITPTVWANQHLFHKCNMTIEQYIPKEHIGKILVSHNGNGQFTSIKDAMRWSGDQTYPVTITLDEGVYEEVCYFGYNHPHFALVGLNKNACILQAKSGKYCDTPIVASGDFYIRNITSKMLVTNAPDTFPNYDGNVFTEWPGYSIHCDGGPWADIESISLIEDCIFYSEAFPSSGCGTDKNNTLYFKNCEFTRNAVEKYRIDTHKGAILVHTAGSGIVGRGRDNRLKLVGNIFKTNYGNTGQIRELGSVGSSGGLNFELTAINNTDYSDELGRGCFDYTPVEGIVNGISFGNSSNNLN